MRLLLTFLLLFMVPITLLGCIQSPGGEKEGGILSKEQVLKRDPEADLFEFNGKVYRTGIGWIEKKELTKGKRVGEISKWSATKLPVGATIYTTEERGDILIVEYDGMENRYLLQIGE
ncbi:hypothetical protein [Gracilibacillus sp. JCM 18860]|uniref:hypothetical protein n=1 Tax=Gracilibacillus sp. JCM 18860 TaxID=1306159 RepID=UPI0006D01B04